MKEIIAESAFRKMLEKDVRGGFLFFGDEDYLKTHTLKLARETVCPDPSLAVFNDMNIDCASPDYTPDSITSALAAVPMMADVKIVTLTGLDVSGLRPNELDELSEALAAVDDFDYNLFIVSVPAGMIDPGYLPKRPSPALSKLCERLTPVNFEKVGELKLCSWILRHFNHNGVTADPDVPDAMLERCGRDMFTLAGEIDKLSYFVKSKEREKVTKEDVTFVTCVSEDYDSFALGTAVADCNAAEALRVLGVMKARRLEPVVILGELSRTLGDMLAVKLLTESGKNASDISNILKIHEYKVKLSQNSVRKMTAEKLRKLVTACTDADASLKLSPQGYVEIEKLVCSLTLFS